MISENISKFNKSNPEFDFRSITDQMESFIADSQEGEDRYNNLDWVLQYFTQLKILIRSIREIDFSSEKYQEGLLKLLALILGLDFGILDNIMFTSEINPIALMTIIIFNILVALPTVNAIRMNIQNKERIKNINNSILVGGFLDISEVVIDILTRLSLGKELTQAEVVPNPKIVERYWKTIHPEEESRSPVRLDVKRRPSHKAKAVQPSKEFIDEGGQKSSSAS